MHKVTKELAMALKRAGFVPEFGDGYLNISDAAGINCEFYGHRQGQYIYLSAT